MADVSIEKLASDIGTTVDRLVGQFKDAVSLRMPAISKRRRETKTIGSFK